MILAVFLSSRGPQKHPAQDHRNRFRNTGGRSSPQPNPTTRGYKRWTFGSRTRRNALEWVRTAKVRLAARADGFSRVGVGTLVVIGVIAAASYAVDFVAAALGAKHLGASP